MGALEIILVLIMAAVAFVVLKAITVIGAMIGLIAAFAIACMVSNRLAGDESRSASLTPR